MKPFAYAVGFFLFCALFTGCEFRVGAQEKPDRPTRQWLVAMITLGWMDPVRVDVVDTEGVCLYIASRGVNKVAISAVPKTQLPSGTGCQ